MNDGQKADAEPFWSFFLVWARIGFLSFGGPAGQIALMHREVVEERGWLSEKDYLAALNFCMLLPGPEAMQLATLVGHRRHGLLGGLVAGLLFVMPGALIMLVLATVYLLLGNLPWMEALFLGVKAAVLVLVIEALIKISKRALKGTVYLLIAGAAFVAIFFLAIPYPLIIIGAALAGLGLAEPQTSDFRPAEPVRLGQTLQTITTWLVVWLTPIGLLWLTLGGDHVFVEIGLFFSKLAVVTFGGAYAVLAYMAQAAVETHGWLSGPEMLDGLGLAETTPGPLILVTEFVGFLAAARADGDTSLAMGLAGAILTLWVTFAPCFLWIFAGAPYLGRIAASPKLAGALQGVTAAVVGVILNLSLWFTIQVLVPGSEERWLGFIRYWTLPPSGFDLWATALAAISAAALLWARIGMIKTLGLAAGLGLLLHVTGLIGA